MLAVEAFSVAVKIGTLCLIFAALNFFINFLQVSKSLNELSMASLNYGFTQAENFYTVVQREIKKKLPRRESERRDHPYCRHADILSAIETRMSLLQITYAKYIETGYCCFIPGKVSQLT